MKRWGAWLRRAAKLAPDVKTAAQPARIQAVISMRCPPLV